MSEDNGKFEPRSFLASYKLPDNSGMRSGIFQELKEGEMVFIMCIDNGVKCISLNSREEKHIEKIEVEGSGDQTEDKLDLIALESGASTLIKVGIGSNWEDEARVRLMGILNIPPDMFIERESLENE